MKRIAKFALWGAIGFGIAPTVLGAIFLASRGGFSFIGLIIMGVIGGASLGLAQGSWKRAWQFSLAGIIGAVLGFIVFLIVLTLIWGDMQIHQGSTIIHGIIVGAVFGASFGLIFKSWKKIAFLVSAGAVGFFIAAFILWSSYHGSVWYEPYEVEEMAQSAIFGIIGGASLGAAFGYLERRKVD